MKHTPLPWEVGNVGNGNIYSNRRLIANTYGYSSNVDENAPAENEANAEYIVMACNAYPKLVEALKAEMQPEKIWKLDIPAREIAELFEKQGREHVALLKKLGEM